MRELSGGLGAVDCAFGTRGFDGLCLQVVGVALLVARRRPGGEIGEDPGTGGDGVVGGRLKTGASARLPEMQTDIEQRALEATRLVAAAHGLATEQAEVIYSGSNVVVRLSPAPVVARVMTGTVVLHNDPRRWLEREVAVLSFLAPTGVAVAPSPLIDPGPHHCDGLWMTFSAWVAHERRAQRCADPDELGRALKALHEELRSFDGDLGTLMDVRGDIERLRRLLRPSQTLSAEMIAALHARLVALDAVVFGVSMPVQALHGDVSLSNLLSTSHRPVWNDFEDTFRGPVHWDVASCVMSLQTSGGDTGCVQRMLDAYGWVDAQRLSPFISAHKLYNEIWHLYDEQRRPRSTPL
jgi:hypothetical protein